MHTVEVSPSIQFDNQQYELRQESLDELLKIGLAQEQQPDITQSAAEQYIFFTFHPISEERKIVKTRIHHSQKYRVRFTDNYTVDAGWQLIKEENDRDYVKKRSIKIGINKYLKVDTKTTIEKRS